MRHLENMMNIMTRKRSGGSSPPAQYTRLSCSDDHVTRKGHVPVEVGDDHVRQRFMVPTRLMGHPSVVALLELSADEFGFEQDGVLRIPCDPSVFHNVISSISKKKIIF